MEEQIKKKINRLKVVKLILIIVLIVEVIISINILSILIEDFDDSDEYETPTIPDIDYNSKFEIYEGKQRGTTVKALINTVIINNTMYEDDEEIFKIILVEGKATDGNDEIEGTSIKDMNEIKDNIKPGKTYKVTLGYSSIGRIKTIGIEEYITEENKILENNIEK